MRPLDLAFPVSVPDWKPDQWELALRIVCSDKPYVVLEAPTGVGKSVIALAVARLLGGKARILTSQKSLQDQYNRMLCIPTVRGRANFPCKIEPGIQADAAVCSVGGPCDYKEVPHRLYLPGCPYYDQRTYGVEAPEAVLNYAYWLAQVNYAGRFRNPDLLICDEAHLLEEEVRRFASVNFRKSHFKTLHFMFPRNKDSLYHWQRWAGWFLSATADDWIGLQSMARRHALSPPLRADYRAMRAMTAAAEAITDPEMPDDGWTLEESAYGVEARPVWVRPLMQRTFIRHTERVLFMSATILDAELFAHQLGIDPNDVEFIRADCPFPKANRPLHYQPVGRINKDTDLDALVEGVDNILAAHPGQHGLIHTVSYKIARVILARSRYADRLISHDSAGEKENALRSFRTIPDAVLVSPSVTTGIDLPYDLCRFQVIAKLNFPDLGDPQIKKRMKLGPDGEPDKIAERWYRWSAACSLVQAYGRGVRADDDACETYLLDGNWRWFRHAVRDMLPKWFTEAIVKLPDPNATTIDDLIRQRSA